MDFKHIYGNIKLSQMFYFNFYILLCNICPLTYFNMSLALFFESLLQITKTLHVQTVQTLVDIQNDVLSDVYFIIREAIQRLENLEYALFL